MKFLSILIERYVLNQLTKLFENPKDNKQKLHIDNPKNGIYELTDIKINEESFEQLLTLSSSSSSSSSFKLDFGFIKKLYIIINSDPSTYEISITIDRIYIITTLNETKKLSEIDLKLKLIEHIKNQLAKGWNHQQKNDPELNLRTTLADNLLKFITIRINDLNLIVFGSDNYNFCISAKCIDWLSDDNYNATTTTQTPASTPHNLNPNNVIDSDFYTIIKDLDITDTHIVQIPNLKSSIFLIKNPYNNITSMIGRIKQIFTKTHIILDKGSLVQTPIADQMTNKTVVSPEKTYQVSSLTQSIIIMKPELGDNPNNSNNNNNNASSIVDNVVKSSPTLNTSIRNQSQNSLARISTPIQNSFKDAASSSISEKVTYKISQITNSLYVKLKFILSKFKSDNTKYQLKVTSTINNAEINVSYQMLLEILDLLNRLDSLYTSQNFINEIYNLRYMDTQKYDNLYNKSFLENSLKASQIEKFINLYEKVDFAIKRKNILYNSIYEDKATYKLNSQNLSLFFDIQEEYISFIELLNQMDHYDIFYGLMNITTNRLQLQNTRNFQPLSSLILFNYIDLNYFTEELTLFKKDISNLHNELTNINTDTKNKNNNDTTTCLSELSNMITFMMSTKNIRINFKNDKDLDYYVKFTSGNVIVNKSSRYYDLKFHSKKIYLHVIKEPLHFANDIDTTTTPKNLAQNTGDNDEDECDDYETVDFKLLNFEYYTKYEDKRQEDTTQCDAGKDGDTREEDLKADSSDPEYTSYVRAEKISLVTLQDIESNDSNDGDIGIIDSTNGNNINEEYINNIYINENKRIDLNQKNYLYFNIKFQKIINQNIINITDIDLKAEHIYLDQFEWLDILYTINKLMHFQEQFIPYYINIEESILDKAYTLYKNLLGDNSGLIIQISNQKVLVVPNKIQINFDKNILRTSQKNKPQFRQQKTADFQFKLTKMGTRSLINFTPNESPLYSPYKKPIRNFQKFELRLIESTLYYNITGEYLKLSNAFDLDINYLRKADDLKASEIQVIAPHIKLIPCQSIIPYLYDLFQTCMEANDMKNLNIISKYSVNISKIEIIIKEINSIMPLMKFDITTLKIIKELRINQTIYEILSINNINIYDFEDQKDYIIQRCVFSNNTNIQKNILNKREYLELIDVEFYSKNPRDNDEGNNVNNESRENTGNNNDNDRKDNINDSNKDDNKDNFNFKNDIKANDDNKDDNYMSGYVKPIFYLMNLYNNNNLIEYNLIIDSPKLLLSMTNLAQMSIMLEIDLFDSILTYFDEYIFNPNKNTDIRIQIKNAIILIEAKAHFIKDSRNLFGIHFNVDITRDINQNPKVYRATSQIKDLTQSILLNIDIQNLACLFLNYNDLKALNLNNDISSSYSTILSPTNLKAKWEKSLELIESKDKSPNEMNHNLILKYILCIENNSKFEIQIGILELILLIETFRNEIFGSITKANKIKEKKLMALIKKKTGLVGNMLQLKRVSTKKEIIPKDIFVEITNLKIDIAIVNDFSEELTLSYWLQLHIKNAIFNKLFDSTSFQFKISFKANNLNYSSMSWEPFLEQIDIVGAYGLIMDIINPRDSKYTFTLSLDESITKSIEFTISEEQIIELLQYMNKINELYEHDEFIASENHSYENILKILQQRQRKFNTFISIYNIENYTGLDIELEVESQDENILTQSKSNRIILSSNESKKWIRENIFNPFNDNLPTDTFSIKFKGNENIIEPLKNISLESADIQKFYIGIKKNNNKVLRNKYYFMYVPKKKINDRAIRLLAPILFDNQLDTTLYVTVTNPSMNETRDFEIMPKCKGGLPCYMQEGSVAIRLSKDSKEYCFSAELSELLSSDNDIESKLSSTKENPFTIHKISHESGLTNFFIFKPIFFLKNCLPVYLELQMFSKASNEPKLLWQKLLAPQEVFNIKSFNEPSAFLKFRIYGSQWSKEEFLIKDSLVSMMSSQKISKNIQSIELVDTRTKKRHIIKVITPSKYHYYVYADAFINDESNCDLLFFTVKDQKSTEAILVPTQAQEAWEVVNKVPLLLLNDQDMIIIAKKSFLDDKTKPLNVNNTGLLKSRIIAKSIKKVDLHVIDLLIDVKNITMDQQQGIKTKMINVYAAYVIINNTKLILLINQEDCQTPGIKLQPQTRSALCFENSTKDKNIILKAIEMNQSGENPISNWSGGLNVDSLQSTNFMLRNLKDQQAFAILNFTVKKQNQINYIVINDEPDDALLKINNTLDSIDLLVYQSCAGENHGLIIKSGESKSYTWDYPEKKKELVIVPVDTHFKIHSKIFTFDKKHETTIKNVKTGHDIHIISEIKFEKKAKVLEIASPGKKSLIIEVDNENYNIITSSTYLTIFNRIGISLLCRSKSNRHEIAYILLEKIKFELNRDDNITIYEFKIKTINIDYNWKKECPHPALLRPVNPDELYKSDRHCIEIIIQRSNSNISRRHRYNPDQKLYFDIITINFWNFTLKLDSNFIEHFLTVWTHFTTFFSSIKKKPLPSVKDIILDPKHHKILTNLQDNFKFKRFNNISPLKKSIVVEEFYISPIQLNSTYFLLSKASSKGTKLTMDILSNSIEIQTLNSIPIKIELRGLKLIYLMGTFRKISKLLYQKYHGDIYSIIKSILKIPQKNMIPTNDYSKDILGICSVYDEMKDKLQPFSTSRKNQKSIKLKQIIETPLYKILISLAEMGKYAYERRIHYQPYEKIDLITPKTQKNANRSIAMQAKLTTYMSSSSDMREFIDIWDKTLYPESLLSVFNSIIEYNMDLKKRDNTKYNNLILYMNGEKNYLDQRLRYPRVFYGIMKQSRNYIEDDSKLISNLINIDRKLYEHISLLETFNVYQKGEKIKNLLVIFINCILLYNDIQNKIIWRIELNQLDKVKKINKQIYISYSIQKDEFRTEENHVILELLDDKASIYKQSTQDYLIDLVTKQKRAFKFTV